MGLVSELRRRNVFRVAIAYVIIAWLILQVGDTLAPALRLTEWVNTVLAFFLILGLPIALILAWAYELTPEGLKKEKDVDHDQSITHISGRKFDYLIIAGLVLALCYFAFDKFVLGSSRDAEPVQTTTEVVTDQATNTEQSGISDKSIAVLPFVNMSSDPEQEYFSDGISEELLNVLSKIPGLQVAARTSSFQFKGKNRDIIDIGQQLNTSLILEGSVRKAGPQIRITAQLIDARNGFHLWSETYDRELENIFVVQDEISEAIVEALKEHLGFEVEVVPRAVAAANTEAHDAYLRGRHLVVQRTLATIEGAIREFEKAIAFDPDYALAHAELAIATLFLSRYGSLTDTEAFAKATPHAERAMALDPTLAEAYAAAGYVSRFQGNAEDALTYFKQAIHINPNYAIVYNGMGVVLEKFLGRYKEAFTAFDTAMRLDPLSLPAIGNHVRAQIDRNRLEEADREIEKSAAIAPATYVRMRGDRMSLGGNWANAALGDLDAMKIIPGSVGSRKDLTWLLAIFGLQEEALAISEHLEPAALSLMGKQRAAVTLAEARLVDDPRSLEARRDLGLALAAAGEYHLAWPILDEMWQQSGGRVTRNGLFQASDAAALIAIHRDIGEEAEIGKLAAAIRDNVRRYREAGMIRSFLFHSVDYEEGLAAYLSGQRESGLALIAKAADDGFFILPNEVYLQVLYDDPGFAPIRKSQEARQARERERFLAIVCIDNPYVTVWRPAEGTCEQFAAAGGS
jgi:TolB-like protein